MSDSLWPHGLQQARLACPSPPPGAYWNSCPSSWWCHPTISSFVVPFSSRLQSFPASGSFPRGQFFAAGGRSIGVSAKVLEFSFAFLGSCKSRWPRVGVEIWPYNQNGHPHTPPPPPHLVIPGSYDAHESSLVSTWDLPEVWLQCMFLTLLHPSKAHTLSLSTYLKVCFLQETSPVPLRALKPFSDQSSICTTVLHAFYSLFLHPASDIALTYVLFLGLSV